MVWNRATWHTCAMALAAGAFSLLVTGCDSGETAEVIPRTAAGADREVFGAATPDRARESVPEAAQADLTAAAPSVQRPVAAPKPGHAAPRVALASARIIAEENDASNNTSSSSDPPPRLTDPPVDASKYPGGIIPASANAQPLPGGPRLLVPHKSFRPEGNPPALRVSYDDLDLLKVLNVDPVPPDVVDQLPDWLRGLEGKRIRIRGFMYPSFQEMLPAFVLTRDTGECCFGPNAKVYYLIAVKLQEGTEVRYVQNRPVDVVGTFHIQPFVSDGQWFGLYKISDAAVVE